MTAYESLRETIDFFNDEQMMISVERKHLVALMSEYKRLKAENKNTIKTITRRDFE